MPTVIESQNCVTAWRDACKFIIENGDGFNLLMHIENPLGFEPQQLRDITSSNMTTNTIVQDVVNTIFPSKLYSRNIALDIDQFYDLHEQIYLRGKRMRVKNRSRWGNYFLRFTKFGDNKLNQLQSIINAINSRNNDQAACYIMHVSSIDYDNNTRIIGNPCLQYVQFRKHQETLHLTAVYRNHDFLTKALGNYIGLSKLLEFVCERTNSTLGSVTCHSIHYYLQQKRVIDTGLKQLTW